MSVPMSQDIAFPDAALPQHSPVFTHNELVIAAPAVVLWTHLVRARRWPEWYANARAVEIDGGDELALGTRFHWTTFGVRAHTVVTEFVPERRLAWSGAGPGFAGYHGWVLEPLPEGATRVITEETNRGLLASLGRMFLRRGLHKWHQRWLEGLARVAQE